MVGKGRPRSGRETKGVSLKVNPEAWELFQRLAQSMGLTRSELLEKIATKEIPIPQDHSQTAQYLGK
ncbi:ribbon-helix-helix protein, CopG family [Nostoc sp. DSM 114167]